MSDNPGVEDLIRRARQDREALGTLLEQYRPFLRLIGQCDLNRRVTARSDASDIVQQTLAKAFVAFECFRGSSEPELSAWIKQIHRHEVDDAYRRNRAAKRSIDREVPLASPDDTASLCWKEPAGAASTPSQRLIRGEKALRLAALLESLPEGQREAVRLRHLEGLPLEQIAAKLNRSLTATAGLIKRGLQALREKMSEQSWC